MMPGTMMPITLWSVAMLYSVYGCVRTRFNLTSHTDAVGGAGCVPIRQPSLDMVAAFQPTVGDVYFWHALIARVKAHMCWRIGMAITQRILCRRQHIGVRPWLLPYISGQLSADQERDNFGVGVNAGMRGATLTRHLIVV